MKVKLFFTEACGYCMPIIDYIKENNLDVELCDATRNKEYRKEILKTGGKMQVPMLSIDGQAMYESRDIQDWLEENM